MPKKPIQWEVYRPIKGAPGAFIGIVEAPDETSALKAAIEEFGIVNTEHQNHLFVRRVPGDDD
jgi:hypothetical protein